MFENGDYVAGAGITTGRYLGVDKMYGVEFHKVFDKAKNLTVFIPYKECEKLRRLPSRKMMQKALKIFKEDDLISDSEFIGSRYRFYKDKMEKASFRTTLEVVHDLKILITNKKATVAERRMFNHLKEKVMIEISNVLGLDEESVEATYFS